MGASKNNMSNSDSKTKCTAQIVSFVPGKEGEKGKYTNIMARLEKDGRSFLVWDGKVTEEEVLAAFRAGRDRAAQLYENAPRTKNGTATVQETEKAPF